MITRMEREEMPQKTGLEWVDMHLSMECSEEALRGNLAVKKFLSLSKNRIREMLRENYLPTDGNRRTISIRLLNAISSRKVDD